jgi:hypothetical protein
MFRLGRVEFIYVEYMLYIYINLILLNEKPLCDFLYQSETNVVL